MICQKEFSITVGPLVDCDPIGDAEWTITVLDPNPGTVFEFDGGDGTYNFNLSGVPGQQGAAYRATSSTLNCSFQYTATAEIDYSIDLTDVGGGSDSSIVWQLRRNGSLIMNETRVAPSPGNLVESGTFSSGPFIMFEETDYTFQFDISIIAIGVGTSSIASGVFRLRPLIPTP